MNAPAAVATHPESSILDVRDLRVEFLIDDEFQVALHGVSFDIQAGETLGMVGESGCGKSVSALSIMQLVQCPPGRITDGTIAFQGQDLLQKTNREMREIRGKHISMIFQEPMTSLNPVYTVGDQIAESARIHQGLAKRDALDRACEMLEKVGIGLPKRRMHEYPHQLSGGMRQRIMIAIALLCRPKVLIADEPTTALDVTIQAQILDLMNELKAETGTSILMITHDLGVIAETSKRVAVMYAGRIVEQAPAHELFSHPLHPYTEGLLKSMPRIGRRQRLHTIPGIVPELSRVPKGCPFHPRCEYAFETCRRENPLRIEVDRTRSVRCWLRNEQTGV